MKRHLILTLASVLLILVLLYTTTRDTVRDYSHGQIVFQEAQEREYSSMVAPIIQTTDSGLKPSLKQFDSNLKQYDSGLKQYDTGLKQFDTGLKQFDSGLKQFDSGLKQFDSGFRQMGDQSKTVKSSGPLTTATTDTAMHNMETGKVEWRSHPYNSETLQTSSFNRKTATTIVTRPTASKPTSKTTIDSGTVTSTEITNNGNAAQNPVHNVHPVSIQGAALHKPDEVSEPKYPVHNARPVSIQRASPRILHNSRVTSQSTTEPPKVTYIGDYKCKDALCMEFLSSTDRFYSHQCGGLFSATHPPKGDCHFINGTNRAPVALVSFPGSGNTWVRGLLEQATGICTGRRSLDQVPLT